MERGVTHDLEFERWANLVHSFSGDAAMDLVNYKKELTLEVMNEKNHVALRYFLHRCWVSEFTACPISTRTRMPWRSRPSKSNLKAGNATPKRRSPTRNLRAPALS